MAQFIDHGKTIAFGNHSPDLDDAFYYFPVSMLSLVVFLNYTKKHPIGRFIWCLLNRVHYIEH